MDFNLIKSIFETLRLTPPSKLTLLTGSDFKLRHYPPTPPDVGTLILEVDSAEMADQVRGVLSAVYAGSHKVSAVGQAGVTETSLGEFGGAGLAYPVSLYVPSLGEGTSFEAFAEIVAHLRAPDGCPWDKEQTHETLRKHLLEESYETLSAIDGNDVEGMREEFGDLLLQIKYMTRSCAVIRMYSAT